MDGMTTGNDRVRCPDPVLEAADRIKEEHDLPSRGEAIRRVFREAGYLD